MGSAAGDTREVGESGGDGDEEGEERGGVCSCGDPDAGALSVDIRWPKLHICRAWGCATGIRAIPQGVGRLRPVADRPLSL